MSQLQPAVPSSGTQLQRRQLLRGAVGAGAATGLALVAGAPARASTRDSAGHGPDLPPVPGMHGDRRANELWYVYEQVFAFNPTPEMLAAYAAIGEAAGGSMKDLVDVYLNTRRQNNYPHGFYDLVVPARNAYALLSTLQLDVYRQYYGRNWAALGAAFVAMGEGSLYDPRMPDGLKVHMMNYGSNGEPPESWHTWHAIIRAMTLLDIEPRKWNVVDRFVGMGWTAQSIARPVTDAVNPPLSRRTAQQVVRQWRDRSPGEVDAAFDAYPYPAD